MQGGTAAVERVFREECGRLIASVVRRFGDIAIAEEAAGEALVAALERWPRARPVRAELTGEAIRLTRILRQMLPEVPEATGLLGLLALTEARREARVRGDAGRFAAVRRRTFLGFDRVEPNWLENDPHRGVVSTRVRSWRR